MQNKILRAGFMMGTGLLMGALFSFQSKSVSQANIYYNRESRISIFKEIQIVKKSNQNLREQVTELEKELISSSNKEEVLNNIKKEIEKYQVLTGKAPAAGEGVKVVINGELEAIWFTDLVNELFSAGAEAISINGIRLSPANSGFDTMPNGQILFGGEILSSPFTFEAIGDAKTLASSINQSSGIIARIQNYKAEYQISVSEEKELKFTAMKEEI